MKLDMQAIPVGRSLVRSLVVAQPPSHSRNTAPTAAIAIAHSRPSRLPPAPARQDHEQPNTSFITTRIFTQMPLLDRIKDGFSNIMPAKHSTPSMSAGIGHGMIPFEDNVSATHVQLLLLVPKLSPFTFRPISPFSTLRNHVSLSSSLHDTGWVQQEDSCFCCSSP